MPNRILTNFKTTKTQCIILKNHYNHDNNYLYRDNFIEDYQHYQDIGFYAIAHSYYIQILYKKHAHHLYSTLQQ